MEQPIDDGDEIYNKNLALVLDFFASKLHIYYSSSRLTLLLTFLSTANPDFLLTRCIPLPSRLKISDQDALDLNSGVDWGGECYRHIFQNVLHSNDPLALDERRYAFAALACLKILLRHSRPPVSRITWFRQHSCALKECMEDDFPWDRKNLSLRTYRRRVAFYWHLRTSHRIQKPQKLNLLGRSRKFRQESDNQDRRSEHLLFLLPKSASSHNILDFARYRVFRFGYLHRKHPRYMKKAIFGLAKYIERVTGETAEVKACESVWGRDKWFAVE